jgi:hypothetical protein
MLREDEWLPHASVTSTLTGFTISHRPRSTNEVIPVLLSFRGYLDAEMSSTHLHRTPTMEVAPARDRIVTVVYHANGNVLWSVNGNLHRDDGEPAAIYADGIREWYTNGVLQKRVVPMAVQVEAAAPAVRMEPIAAGTEAVAPAVRIEAAQVVAVVPVAAAEAEAVAPPVRIEAAQVVAVVPVAAAEAEAVAPAVRIEAAQVVAVVPVAAAEAEAVAPPVRIETIPMLSFGELKARQHAAETRLACNIEAWFRRFLAKLFQTAARPQSRMRGHESCLVASLAAGGKYIEIAEVETEKHNEDKLYYLLQAFCKHVLPKLHALGYPFVDVCEGNWVKIYLDTAI